MLMTQQKTRFLLGLPLAAVLVTSVGACAHERFHHELAEMHEDFHSQPYSRAEHRRLHEDLENYHQDAHDRAYGRDSYYGGGYYGGAY